MGEGYPEHITMKTSVRTGCPTIATWLMRCSLRDKFIIWEGMSWESTYLDCKLTLYILCFFYTTLKKNLFPLSFVIKNSFMD